MQYQYEIKRLKLKYYKVSFESMKYIGVHKVHLIQVTNNLQNDMYVMVFLITIHWNKLTSNM